MVAHAHASGLNRTGASRVAAKAVLKMKSTGLNDVLVPAGEIIETVLVDNLQGKLPPGLPKLETLERCVNDYRQKVRPTEPHTKHDPIDRQYIGEHFVQADISSRHGRCILFAIDAMLCHLRRARTWYIDGTFKVVSKPFIQLLSIHAFLQKDGCVKQVFCLMARRRKRDYVKIINEIKIILGPEMRVEAVVSDFESALWHRGCVFNWFQAVWRKMHEVGLAISYMNDSMVRKFCRKLLALPFLPPAVIAESLRSLHMSCINELIDTVCQYIQHTWVDSNVRSPYTWSVFKRFVRTNNDTEGWHHRLNRRARKSSLSYVLVRLLKAEAKLVDVVGELVCDKKVYPRRRKCTKRVDQKLKKVWDEYCSDQRTADGVLRACGNIYVQTFNCNSQPTISNQTL